LPRQQKSRGRPPATWISSNRRSFAVSLKPGELILGSGPGEIIVPRGLLAQMKGWGWSVLAEIPDREIVFGAVTQPWMANVVFRALPADEFGAFQEPGYVKIVWILGADPIGPTESIARTETRAATTDPTARARFWWYWSRFFAASC
jgi:hypothetical protein